MCLSFPIISYDYNHDFITEIRMTDAGNLIISS